MEKKQKELDNSLKIIFKTSIFVFIGIFLSKVFSYVYRIIIAREFGAEVYGLFSLALIVIGWFVAISSLGLTDGILRYISLYRGKRKTKNIKYIFKICFLILIFSTVFSAVVSFFLADFISLKFFHNSNLAIFLKIFSFMIPFWVFGSYFISVMRAFERIKQQVIIETITHNFFKVFSLIILISFGLKTNAVIFSFFIGILVLFFLSYSYCRFKIPEIFGEYSLSSKNKKRIFNDLVSYSWPIMFFSVVSSIFYWVDSFTIGYFKSAVEVGLYNAAIPIAILLNLAPELFLQMLFPMITKEYSKKNFKLIKELSKQISKWILIINFPVFLLIICFPEAALNILFGAEYLVAANSLRFLLIGTLFSSLLIISSNLMSMIGKSKLILINILLASGLNIILNIWLIPMQNILGLNNSLGINGAAIATAFSMAFLNILLLIQAKHYTSIVPLRRKMLRVIFAALIPFLALLYFRSRIEINLLSIFLLSIFFFCSYFILIFLLKALDKNDLIVLSTVKNKVGLSTK